LSKIVTPSEDLLSYVTEQINNGFLRNTRESQLIFTTHQRDFLQEGEMLRHDVVHFTEKGEDGSTDLYSMADFDSSVIRKGSSLYNAYKSGKLGATPELEDAYIPMD